MPRRHVWRRRLGDRESYDVGEGGAAEEVVAIAEELRVRLSGIATVALIYKPGVLADLTVTPTNGGSSTISVVGIGAGFVAAVHSGTWEITNNSEGRDRLMAVIGDAIEGRIAAPKRWGKVTTYCPAYRKGLDTSRRGTCAFAEPGSPRGGVCVSLREGFSPPRQAISATHATLDHRDESATRVRRDGAPLSVRRSPPTAPRAASRTTTTPPNG